MAPKRPSPLDYPPSASSSDDDELEYSEEEEVIEEEAAHGEDEEEGEEKEGTVKAEEVSLQVSQKVVVKPAAEYEPSDSDESGDRQLVKKPRTLSPVDGSGTEKVSSESDTVVSPAKLLVSDDKKVMKSVSVVMENEEKKRVEDSKRQWQRVFSKESEGELLKGISDFVSKNRKDFMADQNGLYEYVKKELDVEFRKSQFVSKVNNLKKKYKKNDEKVNNGKELKPGEQRLYELSRNIWGGGEVNILNNGVSDVASLSNGQPKRVKKGEVMKAEEGEELPDSEMDEVESDDDSSQFLFKMLQSNLGSGFGFDDKLVGIGLCLIGKSKRIEMVKQWENLLVDEAKLNLRRIELISEQGQLALDALASSR